VNAGAVSTGDAADTTNVIVIEPGAAAKQ